MTLPIRVVIADMAGTTISDDGVVLEAFDSALSDAGVVLRSRQHVDAHDIVRNTMGQSKIDVFRLVFGQESRAQRATTVFEEAYADCVRAGRVKPIAGAEAAFAVLRGRGIKLALTTGFSPRTRDLILEHLDWFDEVDLALSPADAGRGRPFPDMLWTAMLDLRAIGVEEVAVIGDTASDMHAAERAGIGLRCGVLTGSDDAERLRSGGATHIVKSFAELPELI